MKPFNKIPDSGGAKPRRGHARLRHLPLLFCLGILMLSGGCVENYGSIRSSDDLTAAFMQQKGLPDYPYYFCGRYNTPWAIIGIAPEYKLKDRMWTRITNPDALEDLTRKIYYRDRHFSRAADILDPSGNPVGIYFSHFTTTAIKMLPDNGVEIVCPYKDTQGPGGITYMGY